MKIVKMLKPNGKLETSLMFFTFGVMAFVLGLLISSMLHVETDIGSHSENATMKWADALSNHVFQRK